ncbi:MAG TPA: AAA family ATPase, partial [Nakamurella sp.]
VGSTQLADGLDPEEVTTLLGAYRSICGEIVDRFGGFIDDHRGDGMLVLFGYPQVNEDDARRAVHCGQAIVTTLNPRLRQVLNRSDDPILQVRIAVHSDLVVVDGVGVAGATANEAARIQHHAPPNTVVISDATKALVRPYFETSSIGIVALRGVSRPVEIFAVIRERTGARAIPTSPFVGRFAELARLHGFVTGDDRLLFVSGQAGVGKTRLVTELERRYRFPVIACSGARTERGTSLHVFRGLIQTACGIDESDAPAERLAKLRARIGEAMSRNGDLPFLSTALGVPLTMLASPAAVDPGRLRRYALDVAAELIAGAAGPDTTVLFIDDAQWADQSSIEVISHLLAAEPRRLRLIVTARDGFDPPWPADQVQRFALGPLTRAESAQLAQLMPEGANLPAEDLDDLIDRGDGIPLFLEELLRTADALGRGHVVHRSIRFGEYRIPPALLDPLLARLASPRVDLELVQIAATIGRDVDRTLLQRVVGTDEDEFGRRIDTLLAAGLLEDADQGLRFRHELIREVAYESQRRSTRRHNHGVLADMIGDDDPAAGGARERATHLERAGRHAEAVTAHVRIAAADQLVGADVEVIDRLTHTLSLIDRLPDDSSRWQTELAVRRMRSFSAVAARGYGAAEAVADHQRCAELCRALVGAPEIVPTLVGSWSYYAFRGELDQAEEIGAALIGECAVAGIPAIAAEVCFGITEFLRGHFDAAAPILQAFLRSDWARSAEGVRQSRQLPSDGIGVVGAHQAFIHWARGDAVAAEASIASARRRVERLDFPFAPFTSCYIDYFEGVLKTLEGDHPGLVRSGRHMAELADRHGFAMWQLTAALHLDLAGILLGRRELIDRFTKHVTVVREVVGAQAYTPYWLTQLGVAQAAVGRADEALRTLNQALDVADETGSGFYSSETLRIRGRLRLDAGDPTGREDIRRAADLADGQGATALAARARSA